MSFPWLVAGVLAAAAGSTALARSTRMYALASLVGSATILLLQYRYFHYTSDDAYISFRYARNLSDGLGLVWNPGQHVEGYTNFGWVGVLAGLHTLGADIVLSARWLGFALAALASLLTYLLARDLLDDDAGRAAGLAAALLLTSAGAWSLWATAGLEVPLFAVLVLSAVLLHLRERTWRWPPVSGVVWALAVLTRPDAAVLVAVSGAFKLGETVAALRSRDATHQKTNAVREIVWLLIWVAGFAAIYAPYFAWRYETFGWLLPNTYYAKVGHGLDQYDRGIRYVASALESYGGWLLLLVPLAIVAAPIRRVPATYVFTLIAAWIAYVCFVGGDSLLLFRFIAPILPLCYALVAASVAAFVAGMPARAPHANWLLPAVTIAVGAAAIAFTLHPSAANDANVNGERQAVADRAAIGRWLRVNTPPETKIAAVPVGAIAYESQRVIIDMLGINDEHIAHRDVPLGAFPGGHEKYDSEYVLDSHPDIIILTDGLSARPWGAAEYEALRDGLILAVADMIDNPRLATEYDRRDVELREGKWLNLMVRRDATAVILLTTPAPP
jgi:arabinofuranosyltransferase